METKIFWCKVNKYFTEEWLNSDYLKNKEGIFISTCVVTDNAKRKWIKFVKDNIKNVNDSAKLYISWCWAFIDWKVQNNFYELYPELIIHKDKIELLNEAPDNWNKNFEEKIKELKSLYTKKFIIIQSWCDSFCSFCLTVKKRGRHFFRKKEDILKEVINFEKQWWKEIVLTWINLWAWWLDSTNDLKSKPKLDELLRYILENSKIERIRISSLWPEFIDNDLISLFSETRIYPHFHISIQSWSSKILKAMKRHYDSDKLKDILSKIKKVKREDNVEISIWADIIAWFPSETKEDFQETLNLVENYKINKLHSFPFSAHKIWENVIAWEYENQVSDKDKKTRLKELNNLWDEIRNSFIEKQKWKEFKILIESVKEEWWKWWTQNYIEASNENFEIISWKIKRNNVVKGFLKKK